MNNRVKGSLKSRTITYIIPQFEDEKFCSVNSWQNYEDSFPVSIFFLGLNRLPCSNFIPLQFLLRKICTGAFFVPYNFISLDHLPGGGPVTHVYASWSETAGLVQPHVTSPLQNELALAQHRHTLLSRSPSQTCPVLVSSSVGTLSWVVWSTLGHERRCKIRTSEMARPSPPQLACWEALECWKKKKRTLYVIPRNYPCSVNDRNGRPRGCGTCHMFDV